jgi:hypothetical protein
VVSGCSAYTYQPAARRLGELVGSGVISATSWATSLRNNSSHPGAFFRQKTAVFRLPEVLQVDLSCATLMSPHSTKSGLFNAAR